MSGTVGLGIGRAFLTVALPAQARLTLGTDADTIADLDAALGLGSDTDCNADDFMADTAGVLGWALCRFVSVL